MKWINEIRINFTVFWRGPYISKTEQINQERTEEGMREVQFQAGDHQEIMTLWVIRFLIIRYLRPALTGTVNDNPVNRLGMISHKKSLNTIFGHKHKIKNFIKQAWKSFSELWLRKQYQQNSIINRLNFPYFYLINFILVLNLLNYLKMYIGRSCIGRG